MSAVTFYWSALGVALFVLLGAVFQYARRRAAIRIRIGIDDHAIHLMDETGNPLDLFAGATDPRGWPTIEDWITHVRRSSSRSQHLVSRPIRPMSAWSAEECRVFLMYCAVRARVLLNLSSFRGVIADVTVADWPTAHAMRCAIADGGRALGEFRIVVPVRPAKGE